MLLFGHVLADEEQLDAVGLSDKFKVLAREAMGKDRIQELFDQEADFSETSKILDREDKGEIFVKEVRKS